MLIALDVGSYQTRLAVAGREEVLCEPTLVANCWSLPLGIAVGQSAVPVPTRAPERVQVFQPIAQAHLASPGAVKEQLRQMLKRTLKFWSRPAVRLVLPSVASPLERKQWSEIMKEIGILRCSIVQMPVALAWANCKGEQPAVAVVDIGATTSEMALVAADIVLRRNIRWGGDELEAALQRCLYQEHGLEVSRATSRLLKHQLSCCEEDWRDNTIEVRGRDLASGLPVYRDLLQRDLAVSLLEPLERLLELIRGVLDQMPPLMAESVLQQGLTLTGGGANLEGLDRFLQSHFKLPVECSNRPVESSVLGALKVPAELALQP